MATVVPAPSMFGNYDMIISYTYDYACWRDYGHVVLERPHEKLPLFIGYNECSYLYFK